MLPLHRCGRRTVRATASRLICRSARLAAPPRTQAVSGPTRRRRVAFAVAGGRRRVVGPDRLPSCHPAVSALPDARSLRAVRRDGIAATGDAACRRSARRPAAQHAHPRRAGHADEPGVGSRRRADPVLSESARLHPGRRRRPVDRRPVHGDRCDTGTCTSGRDDGMVARRPARRRVPHRLPGAGVSARQGVRRLRQRPPGAVAFQHAAQLRAVVPP